MVRLFLDQPLTEGEEASLSRDHAHYLYSVMRLGQGAKVLVFDGQSGEYEAEIREVSKRGGLLRLGVRTKPLQMPPDLWLLFAPIKKARTDFIVEKAAEMGAARICPVQTDFTNAERIRRDRLQAHVVEAAEQCGGTFVPKVDALARLSQVLDTWPDERRLMFCDEALADAHQPLLSAQLPPPNHPLFSGDSVKEGTTGQISEAGSTAKRQPWAILIGPEGGFSPAERTRLRALPQAVRVGLGPRVLRADTAAVAALTLWQTTLGDWQ